MTHINGLISPHTTTHEPPSSVSYRIVMGSHEQPRGFKNLKVCTRFHDGFP